MPVDLPIMRLPHGEDLPLPAYQTTGAAGMDLLAALEPGELFVLEPRARALIPTGLIMAVPEGYEVQIRPRSGLAVKHGVTVLNSPGTIDSDYRGEVRIALVNLGSEPFEIRRGDRIAQMVVAPVSRAWPRDVTVLDETERGEGGFGSTGT